MPGITLLRIKGGKRAGSPLKLDGTQFTFGRSSECDLRLSSDAASRKHAVIRLKGDAWFLEDMDSRNGTYLNGRKVSSGALRPSDVVKFGESGAKIQILSMDPAPGVNSAGDEETRVLRVAGGGQEAPPARQKPRKKARQAQPATTYQEAVPLKKKGAAGWTWLFPLLGIAFGILTCEGFWTKTAKIADFPTNYVAAPYWLVMRGIVELKLDLGMEFIATWLPRIVLGLWYGLFGLFLQRPWKRRFLIIFWLIISGVAIAMLPDALK